MVVDFCFLDISKLKLSDSLNVKDYIIFSKIQTNLSFEKSLADIILTTFYIYQDTVKFSPKLNKLFSFQINQENCDSSFVVLAVVENWNYALLICSTMSPVTSDFYLKNYTENTVNLLRFLFGTLENSFLKHKQETSIIIDKAIENCLILSLQKPFENLKTYPISFEDHLMEFVSLYNRNEKEYILISDVYLMHENIVLFCRNSDYLLELFLYHSIIKSDNEGIQPKYYFHKLHPNKTHSEQLYSLIISNCFLSLIVLFRCQLKDLKSPPVSLIRRSRVFIKKIGKILKENSIEIKLQNYRNVDEVLYQTGRSENRLINWFRSRSLSLSVNDKLPNENKAIIHVFGDSIVSSCSAIYGLKYRNNQQNFRIDFPLKINNGLSINKINELNSVLIKIDEEMKSLAIDLKMKSFEICYFLDLIDDLNSKRNMLKILGIFDETKTDWLLICVKNDCLVDINLCLKNVRHFFKS